MEGRWAQARPWKADTLASLVRASIGTMVGREGWPGLRWGGEGRGAAGLQVKETLEGEFGVWSFLFVFSFVFN